jgi:hypothetical protein
LDLNDVTGPAQLAFWWKHAATSIETLSFCVDGVPLASTGYTDWIQQSHRVSSGVHTLRWEFTTTRTTGNSSTSLAYLKQLSATPLSRGTLFIVL